MARARNLKPGFYRNEDLAECSVWARLLFPGLWLLADREGRLEDRPKRIRAEILPFDLVDVDPLLDELDGHGFIKRYVVDGKHYIQVLKFSTHQNPHGTEKDSEIPDEDGFYTIHDRSKNHCITGTWRKVEGLAPDSNGCLTVREPLANALNPSSLNPESLNHPSKQQQGATTVGPQATQAESPPEPEQAPPPNDETPPPEENHPPPEATADAITVRAVAIAVLLRQRGAGVAAGDVRLRTWAERGVTDAALLTALETAEKRRAAAGNVNPVNAGLLDAILEDARSPPARSSASCIPWWSTDQTVMAKGRELGLEPRPGESMAQFKGRVSEKVGQAEGVAA